MSRAEPLRVVEPADAAPSLPELYEVFDRIADGSALRERDRVLPFEQVGWLRQARFGALRLGPGGAKSGLPFSAFYAVVIRLGAADSNVAHIFRNHFTIVEQYVRRDVGEISQRLAQQVSNGAIFGLGNTERGAGTVGNGVPTTRLLVNGRGYKLDGTKYYTTGTLYSDYVLVRAADESGRKASVLIPANRAGVEIIDDWDGFGQRLTASGTAHFRSVVVGPEEAVFDIPGQGYGLAYANTQSQLYLTAINAGIARAAADDAIKLLRKRDRSFYHAPAKTGTTDPLLQQVVGQLETNAFAAEAAVLLAASKLDAVAKVRDSAKDDTAVAEEAARAAAKAKLIVDELAIRSGGLLFEVGGASASSRDKNLDRHWRNARTLASHNPAAYKAAALGAHAIDGTPLPNGSFF